MLLGYLLMRVFEPFFGPLGWAAVLAICVYPWNEKLVSRFSRNRAATITTLAVTALIIGPGLFVLSAFVREARAALEGLDRDVLMGQFDWVMTRWERVRVYIPGAHALDLGSLVNQASANVAGFIGARVGGLLADLAVFVFHLFVTLFALYFLLRDAGAIMRAIRRALPFDEPRHASVVPPLDPHKTPLRRPSDALVASPRRPCATGAP